MDHNTAVGKLATGGDPQQLSREIMAAPAEAGKFGYDAIFDEPGRRIDDYVHALVGETGSRYSGLGLETSRRRPAGRHRSVDYLRSLVMPRGIFRLAAVGGQRKSIRLLEPSRRNRRA